MEGREGDVGREEVSGLWRTGKGRGCRQGGSVSVWVVEGREGKGK